MDGVAVEQCCADAFVASAGGEIEREHVRRFDRLRGGESGTDRLATASEASEVVKVDAAYHDDARVLSQRAVQLDIDAARRCAKRSELRWIVSVVLDDSQPLHDERRQ